MTDATEDDAFERAMRDNDITEEVFSDSQTLKRKTLGSSEGDEEFIEVRSKPKRVHRSFSGNESPKNKNDKTIKLFEVCITSAEPLPKQMALAKLLRSQNIKDIIKVKYKNNYKVIITFESEERANNLLCCEEITNKGLKCQRLDQMTVCYGIVRNIDLDMDIKEIEKTFEAECEIESVRRLKRQTYEGKWVDSETIRLGFKGSIIPPYVVAYGCRLIVEPYVFPVTQCTGCWFYGHIFRFCPVKKESCPKCGADHKNCETKEYKCINCSGPHMSLEKSKCPAFKREKEIRSIMSKENCSYKRAFELYEEAKKINNLVHTEALVVEKDINLSLINYEVQKKNTIEADGYRQAVLSDVMVQRKEEVDGESSANESIIIGLKNNKPKNKKIRKKKIDKSSNEKNKQDDISDIREEEQSGREEDERKEKFDFIRLFNRLRDVVQSEKMLDEKITNFLTVIVEECYNFIAKMFNFGNCVNKFLSIFQNG